MKYMKTTFCLRKRNTGELIVEFEISAIEKIVVLEKEKQLLVTLKNGNIYTLDCSLEDLFRR